MWSKLSADLFGKEAQEVLTGALQKGKEAWSAIENSLDQAVDADVVPSEEGILPISIPSPRTRDSSSSVSSSSTVAAVIKSHEDQKERGIAASSSSSSPSSPPPVKVKTPKSQKTPSPKDSPSPPRAEKEKEENKEEEGLAAEETIRLSGANEIELDDGKNVSQTTSLMPAFNEGQPPNPTKKDKRRRRKKSGGTAVSTLVAKGKGDNEAEAKNTVEESRPPTPLFVSSSSSIQEEEEEARAGGEMISDTSNSRDSVSNSGTERSDKEANYHRWNGEPRNRPRTHTSSSGDDSSNSNVKISTNCRSPEPVAYPSTISSVFNLSSTPSSPAAAATDAAMPSAVVAAADKRTTTPLQQPYISTAAGTCSTTLESVVEKETAAVAAAAAERDLCARFDEERRHLQEQLEESQVRVSLLEKEVKKAHAIYMGDEAKQRKIQALQEEGKALALKQSEMEKLVRKSRGELRGVMAERDRLREEGEASAKKVVVMTELIRKKEGENGGLLQTLTAAQAVNKSAAEKTSKLEQELSRAQEEIVGQQAALEKAWSEEKEMKRMLSEMTSEQGLLQTQSNEDQTPSRGLAEIKSDFEQRESVLTATNKQLQAALTRSNFEAGLREDSLRAELGDMRKRWQDAVSRTESLAADMHESTSPLLRQIKALQEEARGKAGVWASTEEAFAERARTAEGSAREAEAGRRLLLEELESLTSNIGELEVQLSMTTSKLHETAVQLKNMEAREAESRRLVSELEQELKAAQEEISRASREGKVYEHKLKLQLREAKETLLVMKGDLEHEQAQLQLEVETLKEELAAAVAVEERGGGGQEGGRRGKSWAHCFSPGHERVSQDSILEQSLLASFRGYKGVADGGVVELAGGEGGEGGDGKSLSILNLEKLQQALRQKEAESQHLQSRLHDVERTRDALAEEVTVLSRQHSLQVAKALRAAVDTAQAKEVVQQKEVLLELLGEKTEELEALQGEMETLKAHFRRQLDQILSQQEQHQSSSVVV